MRNLLVGNGINCQFDKFSYSSQQILLRILKNFDRDDFPASIIVDPPYLLRDYLGELFLKAREILLGRLDNYTVDSAESESLAAFKEKYYSQVKHLRMTDICFEDYYLLHDLLCHSLKIGNPDMYTIREAMRIAYLYAIYNDGKLNGLYLLYPAHFTDYLASFDSIFTTNYDLNLERAGMKDVVHLHGQFDRLSDVYNICSLRNKLPDAPAKTVVIDPDFAFLYCNAITTHSGSYKEYMIKQYSTANACVERMADAYSSDSKIKEEIDGWITSGNHIVENLGYAILEKVAHPDSAFSTQYDYDRFHSISGKLDILGFSPWNDFHIFRTIDEADIGECTYFFYNENDCKKVEELLPNMSKKGGLVFKPSNDIWRPSRECSEATR